MAIKRSTPKIKNSKLEKNHNPLGILHCSDFSFPLMSQHYDINYDLKQFPTNKLSS